MDASPFQGWLYLPHSKDPVAVSRLLFTAGFAVTHPALVPGFRVGRKARPSSPGLTFFLHCQFLSRTQHLPSCLGHSVTPPPAPPPEPLPCGSKPEATLLGGASLNSAPLGPPRRKHLDAQVLFLLEVALPVRRRPQKPGAGPPCSPSAQPRAVRLAS